VTRGTYGFGVSCPRCGGQPCWRAIRAAALLEAHALRAEHRATLAAGRRFPWQPVEAFLRGSVRPEIGPDGHLVAFTDRLLAQHLKVHGQTVGRWRRAGWLSERQADEIAVALGLNPLNLWPDYYEPEAVSAA
jgi:hypothetical protein